MTSSRRILAVASWTARTSPTHLVVCLLIGAVLSMLLVFGPWPIPAALAWGVGSATVLGIATRSPGREPIGARSGLPPRDPPAPTNSASNPDPASQPLWEATAQRASASAPVDSSLFNDPVTGLPNRLQVRREGEARLAALTAGQPAVLMAIDLDRFKAVNDTLGHAHGDMVLMRIAGRLAEQVDALFGDRPDRPPPIVGRLAGDEFTVLLPGTDRAEALAFAARAQASLRRPMEVAGRTVHVGASVGIAAAPDHGLTFARLMRAADDALRSAKGAGRGGVAIFEDTMAVRRLRAERMETELRGALSGGEFSLAFQPQVQLATGRADVVEALLRWGPKGRDPVPAGDFLPVAEDSGLIGPIGHWVAEEVAQRLGEWQGAGWSGRLAVNLSARELAQPGALDHLELSVARAGGRLAGLEVEIGETAIGRAGPDVLATLSTLRAKGVTVTADGFGDGWSRLVGLAELPIDRVKLDGGLVGSIASSARTRAVAASCVTLVHGIGCQVIAAGVETAEQFAILSALGVDAMQGFHVARPMDGEALSRWSYADPASAAVAIAR